MVVDRYSLDRFETMLEEGKEYVCVIDDVGDRRETGRTHFRTWDIRVYLDKDQYELKKINFFPYQAAPMLITLGFKLEGRNVIWDTDEVRNKTFRATYFNEKNFAKLKDFKEIVNNEDVPF